MSLARSGRSFPVEAGESLLDAAIAAGVRLAHGCRRGNCGACRARLTRGEIDYPDGPPLGLEPQDAADGLILMCRARPRGDLELDVDELRHPDEVAVKRLPCRIERAERLGREVIVLSLRLPPVEDLAFLPGQYLDVLLPQGRRRSFSIACPPHDARSIELHVRYVAGGAFTESLFATDPTGRLLTIEGPLGSFRYHPPAVGAPSDTAPREAVAAPEAPTTPLLLVAGGTGYAPIQAILRHVVERGARRAVHLYFGARTAADLYADARIREIARRAPLLSYVPVLSEPAADWGGRRGLVHDAVLADYESLAAFDGYACGPPAMIEAVCRTFPARGLDPARLYVDSFE
ncbi:MAG: 2Fe-2S iron-sulfur cluster binding domain-containing protein [Gammaproteobacteria bacterium]|nr:2Fe-2S iron-sulfur cluster binding domain-containing protein [Gammaproteobacteria bacterium]